MTLDIEKRTRLQQLVDVYGGLLTDHQREVLSLHLDRDWSYGEIAGAQKVSRAAVHDLIRRAETALAGYEAKLGLIAAGRRREAEKADLRRRLDGLEAELKTLRRSVKEIA